MIEEKTIKGLKIIFEENVYDKIVYMNIDSQSIHFTNKEDKNTKTTINTSFDKVKIIDVKGDK